MNRLLSAALGAIAATATFAPAALAEIVIVVPRRGHSNFDRYDRRYDPRFHRRGFSHGSFRRDRVFFDPRFSHRQSHFRQRRSFGRFHGRRFHRHSGRRFRRY